MIEQQARVLTVSGSKAVVRLGGQSGCSACDAGQGCGAGLFGRLLRRRMADFEVENSANAQPGDPVMIGIEEASYAKWVMLLYGLPLVMGLVGAGIAFSMAGWMVQTPSSISQVTWVHDAVTALGGLAFAGATLWWLRRRLPVRLEEMSLHLLHPTNGTLDCGAGRHH